MLKKAVIAAGGFGTRLAEAFPGVPKALVPVLGKPILQRQLEVLINNGIEEIYLTLGHQAERVQDYVSDHQFDAKIECIIEPKPLGTGGALYYLKNKIKESFFMCMGDILFDLDVQQLSRFHDQQKSIATLVVHPNAHPYDSDLVILDDQAKVTGLLSKSGKRPTLYHNLVNAGAYLFSAQILELLTEPKQTDLEQDIIVPLINHRQSIYGYRTSEYLKDIGTPDRLKQAETELKRGTVEAKNLRNKQKAIFLDRDGTINKCCGLISNHHNLVLEEEAAAAIRKINRSSYLAIVVTNQPVIARNLCDFSELKRIHQKLEVLLGEQGAYLDDLYFCPHHPDSGYPEERKELKIKCRCRKPGIAMIEQAIKRYGIDTARSWIIGDSTTDVQTGVNAGIKAILVQTGVAGGDRKYPLQPNFRAANLRDAVGYILESRGNL
jgi:mannose-1-phosphate guanylyltransferase / phosphomannomutase